MVNSLVVRDGTNVAKRDRALRAAQYVRMSTERQTYSIQNQAAVIAAYAHARNLSIVRTYSDEGESGLKISNRKGLQSLIRDISAGDADYGILLVYDVSRWGRFQDTDESAHYEFLCRRAGVKVEYCAEQFENDGSMLSSIVKNLKRVMAAEYSRELSTKVHAGACRYASLGFKLGGPTSYAVRRELVDEQQRAKGILKNGDRKYLTTDHVRLRRGADDEVAVVQWIFQQFLMSKSETVIARELNRKRVPTHRKRPWERSLIGRILRNENYIGNNLYNRRSKKLGGERVRNSSDQWVRSDGCLEPIVSREVFTQVQKIIELRRIDISETEMLSRLRRTLMKRGHLSSAIINATPGLPCTRTYIAHFGTLRRAYELIGYKSSRDCDYIDSRSLWQNLIAGLSKDLCASLGRAGKRAMMRDDGCIGLHHMKCVSFRIARWCPGRLSHHANYWAIRREARLRTGWIVAVRLAEDNRSVLDYVLLPTDKMTGPDWKLSERSRIHHGLLRFKKFGPVIRSIVRIASE